ncbi:MAG: MscS family membrane protein [Myxococcota bacterium]|jgi:MscS family membrane protein
MDHLLSWHGLLSADGDPVLRALALIIGAAVAALVVDRLLVGLARRLVQNTRNDLDDLVVAAVHWPAVWTVALGAAWLWIDPYTNHELLRRVAAGGLGTAAVLLWTWAASRVGHGMLETLVEHQDRHALVQPRTLPMFDIAWRAVVFGGAAYFVLLAWNIDVTGWLASAGVVGIAVGFAAKDTLANLFAGLFILADGPYKLGDYLILEDDTRGRVTEIGLRSTRILTRDEIEVVIPNSAMASSRIINESGGPHEHERIRVDCSVAYASDLEAVEALLLALCDARTDLILDDPTRRPRVRFRRFGDSGIDLQVLAWIHRPEDRGRTMHSLIKGIHKAFGEAGIEIPFPQREVRTLN